MHMLLRTLAAFALAIPVALGQTWPAQPIKLVVGFTPGTAGAITDPLGGQIGVMFVPIHVALPHVKSGKLKALAVGGATGTARGHGSHPGPHIGAAYENPKG